MATVRSLGILEPTALPYLIAEGILPADPERDAYRWHTYLTKASNTRELLEEEILIAGACIVWSKHGVIKRVLNLGIEDEHVLQAFTTFFPRDDGQTDGPARDYDQALVVVLQSQVHILLLSGESHVLPISFEVELAFACPNGFLLQRKVSTQREAAADDAGDLLRHDLSTINESQGTIRTSGVRPSLILSDAARDSIRTSERGNGMPRTFSCVETMSELGLVVFGSTEKAQTLDDCQALPMHETLLYVSQCDELDTTIDEQEPLSIAVTHNTATDIVTIWHVAGEVPLSARTKSKHRTQNRKSTTTRRKSSNVYGRSQAVTTPAPRDAHPLRQSFGGLAQVFAENTLHPSTADSKAASTDELANHLGPEFEHMGVQTRSARRVSSMLARTDLGPANDRNTFHDLAVGHNTRKSMGRGARRGESIGSFSDRQSFGIRRRSSFHGTTSMLSTGTSFLNVPGHGRLDDLEPHHAVDISGNDSVGTSDLRRDVGFFKLTSFAISDTQSSGQPPDLTVLAFPAPASREGEISLSVCTLDRNTQQVAIVDIGVQSVTAIRRNQLSKKMKLKATTIRRGSAVSDICLVRDESIRRLLVLSKTRQGEPLLHLEAPWSTSYRLELPQSFLLTASLDLQEQRTPTKRRDDGSQRYVPTSTLKIGSIVGNGQHGQIALLDSSRNAHAVHVQLAPKDAAVHQVLSMCNLIFGEGFQDAMLVAFWEVQRWLKVRESHEVDEWSAMVVCLFTLAVPFIDDKQAKYGTPSRRKRAGPLRSASGTVLDLSDFNAMNEAHLKSTTWIRESHSWQWMVVEDQHPANPSLSPRSPRHSRSHSQAVDDTRDKKESFVLQCIGWAREFSQSPAGEAATGPEGYLPISINKDRNVRQTALAKALIGLHLLYEEQKLTPISDRAVPAFETLPGVMSQLGTWLGWTSWTMDESGYYLNESTATNRWLIEDSRISGLDHPDQPFEPASILQTLCKCITSSIDHDFPSLDLVIQNKQSSKLDSPSSAAISLTPRTHALLAILKLKANWKSPLTVIERLREQSADAQPFLSIPDGFAAVFHQACAAAQVKDLKVFGAVERAELVLTSQPRVSSLASHSASKDYHASSIAAFDDDGAALGRWDMSWEADRVMLTKLIFPNDRRYREASRLVNQTRPPVVECNPKPGWSEADLLEAQKDLAQLVARRTLSVATGRAMLHFSFREPLLTERVPIAAFSLQCSMSSRTASDSIQPMTFSADKSSFTEEKVCWAFFHNGASSGLMISRDAKCIDTSWILYNKPQDLTNRHAGFLLALGLNGHLRALAKWVAFKYLTPKHTMTSIGLLLGLSASYIGTQDQLITRLLSVHVTRLLPPGAAELNLSPLTQTTGIMGIGLLYHNSQHRRMSEVMLSELENNDSEEGTAEEHVLRDESYRLAAGFSLGLINLGHGAKLHGLREMSVPERLLSIAIGTKNVNLVHVLDRATAGAVMATAFVFLKSNDAAIARKIDIPDTVHQFDYVRPDIFLLRTLARHLIMWDSIKPTKYFVAESLPTAYRRKASLGKTKHLATEDLPFFNILAGICFALGLRYAGSQRSDVRDLLVGYLDHFLRLSRLPCPHYDARVTLNGVRNCLDLVALASATVMAGSGDIIVMRRLRSLHGRVDKDTPFGSHMAAHMAIGVLFLCGGTKTFGTSDLAVASLCIAFYPLFPGDVLDNRAHLQALRHLWVLAVEGRCLVCREEANGRLVGGIEARIHLQSGETYLMRSPGLLPEFDSIARLEIATEGWWPVTLDFSDPKVAERIKKDGAVNIWLERQAHFDRSMTGDVLCDEMRVLDEQSMRGIAGVPSINPNMAARTHPNALPGEENPFDWLFDLESLKSFDAKERDLVVNALHGHGRELLKDTPVDARLAVERGLLPEGEGDVMSRAKMWELRALLNWFERFDAEDEQMDLGETRWADGLWLRREVVDGLRERVWDMMTASSRSEK